MLTSCTLIQTQPIVIDAPTDSAQPNLPNPASVYCQQQGHQLKIRTVADGSQSCVCVFPDGSECDEWAYYRGGCGAVNPGQSSSVPTEIPTPMPVDPANYQGWWTYSHPVYAFSVQLPEDWIVDQTTSADPLMNDHTLMLHPGTPVAIDLNIRMTFRIKADVSPEQFDELCKLGPKFSPVYDSVTKGVPVTVNCRRK